jgi:hypothetical protein
MDSRALGLVLRLNRALQRRAAHLTLCGLHATIKEVMRITRLDRMLVLADSVDAALAVVADPSGTAPPAAPQLCACCGWPREAECKVCRTGFCCDHGYVAVGICRRHRWVAWVGLLVTGAAVCLGLTKLSLWLRG